MISAFVQHGNHAPAKLRTQTILLFPVKESAINLQVNLTLAANEKNAFISDLGSSFRFWYDKAIAFLLGASEDKPFPWQKI